MLSAARREPTGYERILRYPEGERLLRYPQTLDGSEEQSHVVEAGDSEDGRDAYESQEHLYWDECDLWGSACNPAAAYQTAPAAVSAAVDLPPVAPTVVIPSVDIMRQLQLRQAEAWQHVRDSYQILHGCPWVNHRPLFILVTQPNSGSDQVDAASEGLLTMYALRTRVDLPAAEDVGQVFAGLDLGSRLSFSQVKNGIVSFEREQDAEAYAATLAEEDVDTVVSAVEVDSHELFVLADDIRSVVVHVGPHDIQPLPYQLASVLQGHNDYTEW
ncbi:MAG: hypothetical protein WDW38_000508 [Sanguina aurantia]